VVWQLRLDLTPLVGAHSLQRQLQRLVVRHTLL
jgi:hypothetical protein